MSGFSRRSKLGPIELQSVGWPPHSRGSGIIHVPAMRMSRTDFVGSRARRWASAAPCCADSTNTGTWRLRRAVLPARANSSVGNTMSTRRGCSDCSNNSSGSRLWQRQQTGFQNWIMAAYI
jgi:hypothetical protein